MSRERSNARRRALQALYQWQLTGQSLSDIETQFLQEEDMAKTDLDYFKELLHQIPSHITDLEAHCLPHVSRPMEQVDPVERAALLIGLYELQYRLDVPYRVAINEAVELAKSFGAEQGHKFVNGLLDKVAKQLRAAEFKAKSK
ncbi:MAG TPA: transcription antitermination factor NusB [Gammaproteobacteria bacterium]